VSTEIGGKRAKMTNGARPAERMLVASKKRKDDDISTQEEGKKRATKGQYDLH